MPKNKSPHLFITILLAASITSLSSEIYAPSVPEISRDLGTSFDIVQWSMALFMVGVSLSQLFYGPYSEGVGRKKSLTIGLFISLIGCSICYSAPTDEWLLIGRFVQGLGAGAGSSLWRAVFRDSYTGDDATKHVSYLSVVTTAVLPGAPILGSTLTSLWGWRSIFLFLVIYILLTLYVITFHFEESNKEANPKHLSLSFLKGAFTKLITSPVFMGYCLCSFLCYGAFFSWLVVGPVLLIETLGLTPMEFSWFALLGGGGAAALSSYINGRIVPTVGTRFTLHLGFILMITAGALMISSYYMFGVTLWGALVPIALLCFSLSFMWAGLFTSAFAPFGHIAGYAGALYSAFQLGGAGILGSFLAFLPDDTPLPLGLIFLAAPGSAFLLYRFAILPREKKAISHTQG